VNLQIIRITKVASAVQPMVTTTPLSWVIRLWSLPSALIAGSASTPVSRAPAIPPMPCTPKASRLSSYLKMRLIQTAPA